MTQPYLKHVRAPRRLLYSLTVIPVGENLGVEEQWYGPDLTDGIWRAKILRKRHRDFPIQCTHVFDYTGGWHNMANILKHLGLPYRRVLVTEYAFSLTQAR